MADGPKSFWPDEPKLDPDARTSHLDGTHLRPEADILFMIHKAGITLPDAAGYELWELAAAVGLHYGPTIAERDATEIIDKKQAEWDATADERMRRMAEAAERRKNKKRTRANR